jgi:hypothetical protein
MIDIKPMMSGWYISNYQDITHTVEQLEGKFSGYLAISKLTRPRALEWVVENYDIIRDNTDEPCLFAILHHDDMYKVAIMENHPSVEAKLKEHFGENWANHYLRFGH